MDANFWKVVLFAAIGSLWAGYSLAVIVSTLGQPTWYLSLNLEADPTAPGYTHTTTIIGAVNGAFFGAGVVGTLISGWFGDRLGRVNNLRLSATVGIIGAVLQTAAVNQGMVSGSLSEYLFRLIIDLGPKYTDDR